MLVKRMSVVTGKINEREVPCTQEQYDRWQRGELIQHAMPNVSADDREFLISGMLPEEWNEMVETAEEVHAGDVKVHGITWRLMRSYVNLGWLPEFLSAADPRPAREQLDHNYRHGGGWRPGRVPFKLTERGLEYPGDPPIKPLAEAKLRDETIRLYESDWVAIIQKDGSHEISRMD